MLKNYFKIFLKVASQSKLFTFLSLFGISLTIMFVMIFSMTISKITRGSGPEKDLNEIIFCQRVKTVETHKGKRSSGYSTASLGKVFAEDLLKKTKNADIISMYTGPNPWEFIFNGNYQKKLQNQTDAEYWKIFNYKFLEGKPYTGEEVINGANLAVITKSLKELLFGDTENVLGKTIKYTSMNLVVTGVVEDPPKTDQNAIGDLYFPYTILKGDDFDEYIGGYKVAFKSSQKKFELIRNEVQNIASRIDAADTTRAIFLSGPYSQIEKMMVGYGDPEDYSKGTSLFKYLMMALAFILLPAINLMSLNFARIHERGEEIAIRKSFGADNKVLRGQFLFENILMTLAGGLIGIILSYIVVALLGNSLTLSVDFMNNVPLSFSFDYKVFAATLIACLVFGLLSGFLPAVRLSRMKPAAYLKGGEL
ncbi:MAG TPA: FtsX-like permease family protein [Bacteroidales bacterium]|nr:FtsX-like permease family protein [Bacteroidales bacterium]